MITITATEASRTFAALLDRIEQGEQVLITRGGRRIAVIGPTSAGNGADLIRSLGQRRVDEQFAKDVLAARDNLDDAVQTWPED